MLDKLEIAEHRFEEVGRLLTDPNMVNDRKKFAQLSKEYKDLETLVGVFRAYKNATANYDSAKTLLQTEKDDEMRQMAKEEMEILEVQKKELEDKLRFLVIPKEPEDAKNAVLEIRAGTGGDEASLFAGELSRMYQRFCEKKGWQVKMISESEGTMGGYKEVQLEVSGEDVYGTMKFESGVHRVQRVPATEANGRVHTSAASVAVMPEADEIDLETKVLLTHIPTGVVVVCQTERTQLGNREKAMQMLRTRLYDEQVRKHEEEIARRRKTLVSTGDRSAKIRTYNFPQGRITDHRIGMTVYTLDQFMNGDIQEMMEALQLAENTERLNEHNNG
jgi:peptide chain release factor 1